MDHGPWVVCLFIMANASNCMNKLTLLIVLAALALVAGFTLKAQKPPHVDNPTLEITFPTPAPSSTCTQNLSCPDCNLILISVDSLRADHVGVLGYKRNTTPNFDSLSKKGVLFTNYFTSSFLTPVSEMSVHTGMYPTSTGVRNFDTILPDKITTLPQILKREQYLTSALLSSPEFEINPALKTSFSRGFDSYKYQSEEINLRDLPKFSQVSTELDQFGKQKFFFWLVLGEIHWPFGKYSPNKFASVDYHGFFKGKELDWETFQKVYQDRVYPENIPLSETDIQYVKDSYDNGIGYFDSYLGKLVDFLKKRGLLDKTVLVIVSEHGEELGEHDYFAHYDIFDNQVHTPLLILSPKITTGTKIETLVSGVDVLPTVLELMGLASPNQVQGQSLVPLFCDKQTNENRAVFIERNPLWEETIVAKYLLQNRGINIGEERHQDVAIRTKNWKYIWRMSKAQMEKISWWAALSGQKISIPEAELYNLTDDQMESKNVVDKFPDVAQNLKKQLEQWFSVVNGKAPAQKLLPGIQEYF